MEEGLPDAVVVAGPGPGHDDRADLSSSPAICKIRSVSSSRLIAFASLLVVRFVSTNSTLIPMEPRRFATVSPVGPPPTTTTCTRRGDSRAATGT